MHRAVTKSPAEVRLPIFLARDRRAGNGSCLPRRRRWLADTCRQVRVGGTAARLDIETARGAVTELEYRLCAAAAVCKTRICERFSTADNRLPGILHSVPRCTADHRHGFSSMVSSHKI